MTLDDLPDWERLLAAERHLQGLVPGTVLVGGTAAALHAGHRTSLDGDHVLEDLRPLGWNRSRLDLASDESLAQLLDRGDLAAWRELYALAGGDDHLRRRILALVRRVPLPYPAFWLAALASLGESLDWTLPLPADSGIA